jgi:hypothetical protein
LNHIPTSYFGGRNSAQGPNEDPDSSQNGPVDWKFEADEQGLGVEHLREEMRTVEIPGVGLAVQGNIVRRREEEQFGFAAAAAELESTSRPLVGVQ